jgi:hypothetical protein
MTTLTDERIVDEHGRNGAAEEPGVPWVDTEIQQQIQWRDGDVVVSVPVKSGTTWTMNIVHQLRAGGDPDLEDVYIEVPWLELVPKPGTAREALVAKIDAMPDHRRRAFKTHSPPGPLPYHAPGDGPDVKYVVVVRSPEEALASMYPFIASHSDAWFALWGMDRTDLVPPDFATFFEAVAKPMAQDSLFGFIAAWWPLRHAPNVLFLHFSDMKRDHEGSVRKIARFLGFEPSDAQWPTVLECTSFQWMKQHEACFELRAVTEVQILNPGAMVRKGRVGAAHEDGVTPAIAAELAQMGREVVTDPEALEWAYRGGPLP